ncbi:DUF916 domain-containing protein [Pseudoalteromonas sp. 2CM28B]|uniref:DUF916 domain-containing protein n=1 Tax=Pseudoalteromonas sp. 2CM28B TaxID=2929851 RepID=UPI0020BE812B|nr:DUF916 domain-containing protein [Pseudoalteromonas sp. 2CM28B]MCK8135405.1 DUF916 domain-containing protein [Pseudoalteromonas sp. 2CM28B]
MHILLIFIFCLFSFSVNAFQVRPMVADLSAQGSQSQQTLRIINPSDKPLTIDVSAFNMSISDTGVESLEINEEDFLIIPMTTIIPPGSSQSVIVRYIGEPIIEHSKSYRITVEQVSVDLNNSAQSGVGMSLSFRTLFNVVPDNAKANLIIKEKKQLAENQWGVSLENQGNKYVRLSKAQWNIKSKDKVLTLEGMDLSRALSGKILLPNSKSNISISIPKEFQAADSELEVIF